MGSHRDWPQLVIRPRFSRLLACFVVATHLLAVLAVWSLPIGVYRLPLGLLVLASFVEAPVERLMFEVISAFATVGLSTGLSAELPPAGQIVLVVMMYVGRVGTVALATALALKVRTTPFRYPEERPIVG